MQFLPFVGRSEDCRKYHLAKWKNLGYFSAMSSGIMLPFGAMMERNDKAHAGQGKLSFAESERPKDLKPITVRDTLCPPYDVNSVRNLLIGSWRFFYESLKIPTIVDVEKLPRKDSCITHEVLHFDVGGNFVYQRGSWETGCKQSMDDSLPFWQVFEKSGKIYVRFTTNLKNLSNADRTYEVIHISKDRLILKNNNLLGGGETIETIRQLFRIEMINY